jgi:hypothetical protein
MKNLFFLMSFILQLSIPGIQEAFPQVSGDHSSSLPNGTWSITGQAGFSADQASSCELKIHPSGMPWVAYWHWGYPYSHSYTNVMAFSGSSWASAGPDSISDGYFVSLAFSSSGIPYVALAEYSNAPSAENQASVKSFDGTAWNYTGNRYFSQGECWHIRIAMSPADQPYVAFQDVAHNNELGVMKYDGTSWVYAGSPAFSGEWGRSPFIAFNPATDEPWVTSQSRKVWRFDGSVWTVVGGTPFTQNWIDSISMAFTPSGQAYIAYCDGGTAGTGWKATVKTFDGTQWVDVGNPGISSGAAGYTSIAISPGGAPVVAFRDDANGSKATVMAFDGTQWVTLGQPGISAGVVDYTTIAFAPNGALYLAYCDSTNSGKVTVQQYDGYLGINDLHPQTISISPNPSSDVISVSNLPNGHISIFNIRGQQFLEQETNGQKTTLDISSLPGGLYILKVTGETGVQVGRFIKQ